MNAKLLPRQFILPRLANRERQIDGFAKFLRGLPLESAWCVQVSEHKPTRSDAQNRTLWMLYGQVIEKGGEAMAGWTKDDLHAFFLMTHFGSEVRELFGRKRHVPLRRSSRLNKQEFSDLLGTIERFMAERGVSLDMPGDV